MNYYQPYNSSYGNQYFSQPQYQYQPMQPLQNQQLQNQQLIQQAQKPSTLQGKSVDSIEVVKAMDIPLDGSISYFPLADNSAIVTKQLMPDGTSRTLVYKPYVEKVPETQVQNYVTVDEFDRALKERDDLIEEIEKLKKQFKDFEKTLKDGGKK